MEIRTRIPLVLIAGVAVSVSGCTLVPLLRAGSGGSTSTPGSNGSGTTPPPHDATATYDGPECKRVLWQLDELDDLDYNAKETTPDPSYETQILLAVCKRRSKVGTYGHDIPTWPRFEPIDPRASYLAQDDWKLDPIAAALSAIHVAAARIDTMSHRDPRESDVGLALMWTQLVTAQQLEQALASVQLQVPDAAKTALVALYRAVPSDLEGAIPAETRFVLVDVPVAVYTERQSHYTAYRAMYQRLATLRAQAAAASTDSERAAKVVAGLEKLRSEFITACKKLACRDLPLYANASAALAQLHVVRRDVLMARTESFHNHETYTAGFAHAVHAAQAEWINGYDARRRKYQTAIENGSDEKTAQSIAGGPVGDSISSDVLVDVELELPSYAAAIEDEPRSSQSAYVASIGRGGGQRRVTFKKDRMQVDIPYACKRTHRIERIRDDGTIDYETSCKYRKETQVTESHAPIEVPAAEVASVRAGDLLVFMSGPGGSRVLEVMRGGDVVQIRGDRVKE
jgi:hypothetical protein